MPRHPTPKPDKVYKPAFWLSASRENFTAKAEAHFDLEPAKKDMGGVTLLAAKKNGTL